MESTYEDERQLVQVHTRIYMYAQIALALLHLM